MTSTSVIQTGPVTPRPAYNNLYSPQMSSDVTNCHQHSAPVFHTHTPVPTQRHHNHAVNAVPDTNSSCAVAGAGSANFDLATVRPETSFTMAEIPGALTRPAVDRNDRCAFESTEAALDLAGVAAEQQSTSVFWQVNADF